MREPTCLKHADNNNTVLILESFKKFIIDKFKKKNNIQVAVLPRPNLKLLFHN